MSPIEPAEKRLERVLAILPLAAREGGVRLEELAAQLEVPVERVIADVQEVADRVYHHPPGRGVDIEIGIEEDRVEVWTSGEFRRPHRLTPREALALTIGLRGLAQAEPGRAEELRALASRLDRELAAADSAAVADRFSVGGDATGDAVLAILRDAAEARQPCRLRYLKSGADAPDARLLHPYVLVYSGRWYALGPTAESDGIRAFRLDRIVSVEVDDGTFDVPEDFDPDAYVTGVVVYTPGEEVEAVVRHPPAVARWVAERGGGEPQPDGSVLVRHRVSDPEWILRHVLSHGAAAELLEPPELRRRVVEVAEGLAKGPR